MNIVFDPSTLILLARIDLLRHVAEQYTIIIPDRVLKEAVAKDTFDAVSIRFLVSSSHINVVSVQDKDRCEKIMTDFRIHAGEAEALCCVIERDAPLAVDDGPTIKVCKLMGRPFVTAIHFVINLNWMGVLKPENAREKLKKLSVVGRYRAHIIQDAEQRITGGTV